jgi:protein tyrosine phosphatase (PTP) superfamily phosphohydrolase (DUF442 family)
MNGHSTALLVFSLTALPACAVEHAACPARLGDPGARVAIPDEERQMRFDKLRGKDGPVRFSQVNEQLYRGGQPSEAQLEDLKALGVTTIISLRKEDRDVTRAEEQAARRLGIRFLHFPFYGIFGASRSFLEQILAELRAPDNGVIYIHCKRGRDRTSVLVALHLVIDRGWTPDDAWQRAVLDYGYQPSFWYRRLGAVFDAMVRAYRKERALPRQTSTTALRI